MTSSQSEHSSPILGSPPNPSDMPANKKERDNLVPSIYVLSEIKKRHKIDDSMKVKFSITQGNIVKGLGFKIDYDTLIDILKDLDLTYDREVKYLISHAVPKPKSKFFLFKIFDFIFNRK